MVRQKRTAVETIVSAFRKKKKKEVSEKKLVDAPNIVSKTSAADTSKAPPVKTPIEQPGTAAPGTQPNFRTTIQGDRFDINLPIIRSNFSSDESYFQARGIKISGGGGFSDIGETSAEEQIRLQAEAPEQLEAAGAFEQVTPERVELSEEAAGPEKFPLVGGTIGAIANLFTSQQREAELGQGFDAPISPETTREMALREIRDKSFKEGVTFSESIGTIIEGIPLVGGLARKYAGGLTQTPSANADAVIAEIDKVKEAASTGQEKVRNGLEDPDFGLDRARSMEEQVAKLEGRLKALINVSPILRANTDEVNKIEEGILEAREKIARYRRAASFGLTASLTGTGRTIPTDEQMFFALKEGRS